MTDEQIRSRFTGADDLIARELRCGGLTLYAYAIDGLIASTSMSEYILKPISENLRGQSTEALYHAALDGSIYNNVAKPCKDLEDAAQKLVNGFCVVLFPGAGAIAFEVRTSVSRGPSTPEVENTVKGPKDAFVETMDRMLGIVTTLGKAHDKVPALTEVGYEGVPDAKWWTGTLWPLLEKYPTLSYVLVWRNARERVTHFYAPYPGQASAADFVEFYKNPKTLFASDVQLYQ